MTKKSLKVKDAGEDVSRYSRIDRYYQKKGIRKFYNQYRTPELNLPLNTDQELNDYLLNKFHFRAIEFGNWVNNTTRANYLLGATVGFYDINKAIQFDYELGLFKTLGIAFGSRGTGRALAHFEPGTFVINLTRYSRGDNPLNSGGTTALAHEFGHALDYFFGSRVAGQWALTGGRSVKKGMNEGKVHEMVHAMDLIIRELIFDKKHITLSPYYERLERISQKTDYFIRRNELFARAFEQYVQDRLEVLGIQNRFLTKTKYNRIFYLMDNEKEHKERVYKRIDDLLKLMREWIREQKKKK